MNIFFIVLEFWMYLFAIYIGFKKRELVIVYLPVLFFANTLLGVHVISSMVYYATISILLISAIIKNGNFTKANFFAFVLFFYLAVLLGKSDNLVKIREDIFNVSWLLLSMPLITTIYRKYSKQEILSELSTAGVLILTLFVINVLLSTYFHYSGPSMYGITTGILYGNLYATDYNILSIAMFIVAIGLITKPNLFNLVVWLAVLVFIGLSLRRSVMTVTAIGAIISVFLYFLKDLKKAVIIGVIGVILTAILFTRTNVVSSFNERYEIRNLEERGLDEEKRLFEYELLYKDMFV